MNKVNYAYDVLYYETFLMLGYALSIRIKKFRFKSHFPLITASVTRSLLIEDLSQFPDNYDEMCSTVEIRLKSSLSLSEMVAIARELMRDKFMQLDLPFDED